MLGEKVMDLIITDVIILKYKIFFYFRLCSDLDIPGPAISPGDVNTPW